MAGAGADRYDVGRKLGDRISERVLDEVCNRWGDEFGYELLDAAQQSDPDISSWPVSVHADGYDYDVEISVTITEHRPPGWERTPVLVGKRVVLSGAPRHHTFVVREVLGDNADPRPGYRVQLDEPYLREVDEDDRAPFVITPDAVVGSMG